MALYHSARGSVDYTIVGRPTIVDGVVSGFSNSNYLTLNPLLPDLNDIEGQVKFTTASQTGQQGIIFQARRMFNIDVWNGQKISTYNWATNVENTIVPTSYYAVGATYIVKFKSSPSQTENRVNVAFSYSKNGGDFSTPVTYELFKSQDNAITLGNSSVNTSYYFGGSIDLNETYIKVNGKLWFGICPVEVKKHQIMGPVGYTITGTGPTVTDGILTGVGGSSTVYTSQTIPSFETFELVTKVKKNELSPNAPLPALALSSTAGDASYRVVVGGILSLRVGSSTPVISLDNFPYASLTGKWFYIRLNVGKNGNNYDYSIGYSTDKQNWTTGTGTSSSVFTQSIGFLKNSSGNGGTSSYMDFNETYIKINGKLWFYQPQATKYIQRNNQLVWADPKLYLSGPVNYEVVGSPTITDGVASGFSVSDYVNLSSTLTSFDEIVLSFIPGTYSSGRNVLFKTGINDYRGAFQQVSDTQGQYFYTKTDNTAGNRYVPCTPGIVNIFKIQYISENSISCILSRQGYEDRAFDLTDVDISATFGGSIYLGRGTSAYNAWSGSIDLNNTYIKVNNQLWFYGKNNATRNIAPVPAGYTYGNTTTSAIGYVDMRTQQFTPAPEGATIGRDE